MTKKKIAIISPFPPPEDGIAEHTKQLIFELGKNFKFEIWTKSNGVTKSENWNESQIRRIPFSNKTLTNLGEVSKPSALYIQFAIAAYGLSSFRLVSFVRKNDGRIPVVVDIHEIVRDIEKTHVVGRMIYRQLINGANLVLVHTLESKNLVKQLAPNAKIEIVDLLANDLPQAINQTTTELPPIDFLAPGFITPSKGTDLLVKVWQTDIRFAELNLLIAGTPRKRAGVFRIFELGDWLYASKLKRLARDTENIKFMGFLDNESFRMAIEQAKVVVLPYREVTQSGILSLAQKYGATLVTSDLEGFAQSLGISEKFESGNHIALAEALQRTWKKGKTLRSSLGESQTEMKSNAEISSQMLSFLDRLGL